MNQTDLEYFKLLLNSQLKELEERIGYSDIQKMDWKQSSITGNYQKTIPEKWQETKSKKNPSPPQAWLSRWSGTKTGNRPPMHFQHMKKMNILLISELIWEKKYPPLKNKRYLSPAPLAVWSKIAGSSRFPAMKNYFQNHENYGSVSEKFFKIICRKKFYLLV